jgi:hypothetical protein
MIQVFLLYNSPFYFPHMKYGKYWFQLQFLFYFLMQIFTYLDFLYLKTTSEREKKIRQSHGVARGIWTTFEAQVAQPC